MSGGRSVGDTSVPNFGSPKRIGAQHRPPTNPSVRLNPTRQYQKNGLKVCVSSRPTIHFH